MLPASVAALRCLLRLSMHCFSLCCSTQMLPSRSSCPLMQPMFALDFILARHQARPMTAGQLRSMASKSSALQSTTMKNFNDFISKSPLLSAWRSSLIQASMAFIATWCFDESGRGRKRWRLNQTKQKHKFSFSIIFVWNTNSLPVVFHSMNQT